MQKRLTNVKAENAVCIVSNLENRPAPVLFIHNQKYRNMEEWHFWWHGACTEYPWPAGLGVNEKAWQTIMGHCEIAWDTSLPKWQSLWAKDILVHHCCTTVGSSCVTRKGAGHVRCVDHVRMVLAMSLPENCPVSTFCMSLKGHIRGFWLLILQRKLW